MRFEDFIVAGVCLVGMLGLASIVASLWGNDYEEDAEDLHLEGDFCEEGCKCNKCYYENEIISRNKTLGKFGE